ncbi:RHS repeat-associated protein [Catenulispora sp. EB89]|uniref:DUF6531 domain-containing protein n=1 Tax=Catenulispora sp. EB89 TaxID=3156257 RepID=UPI00351133B5
MVRPTGWDILGLDGDPTPGVVESVQALAKEFGDFAHDVESAYRSLNSFGSDTAALQWVGQTADAFKSNYGPLPGRLQKLYTSYSEASDALTAYAPKLQAAQSKADSALRQAQDANTDLQRATTSANTAAADLKTAQQNHAAVPNPQAVTDAQTAHDTAQTNLNNAKSRMAALTAQAHQAYDDRIAAAKDCARAIGHAQSDGIHNKHWWEHIGADLADWGGKIADIAGDLAPFLDVLALATSWIPGVDVITAGLAEADNLIALVGTGLEVVGDGMQGHWGDALMGVGMLGAQYLGGKALEKFGGPLLEKFAARGNKLACEGGDPVDVVSGSVIAYETDAAFPGVLRLVFRRSYSSAYRTGRLLGSGWSSTLDQRLAVTAAGIHFTGDDAQLLAYPVPEPGQTVLPREGARWPLEWDRATDEIRISDPWLGCTWHFGVVHHRTEEGQIRDVTAMTDRNGNRIDYLRDTYGTPVEVQHSGGYRVGVDTVVTGSGPRIAGLRLVDESADGGGVRLTAYTYDGRGRLTGVVNSSEQSSTYEYDDEDRMTASVDRLGFRYEYEYDDYGRAVRGTGTDGFLSAVFTYDQQENTTIVTDSLGYPSTFQYDENGHVLAYTDPLGNRFGTEYDRYGRILSRTDPLGNRTIFEYDGHGDPVRMTGPDGAVTSIEFNAFHQVASIRTAEGPTWFRRYDDRGNLVEVVEPSGAVTRAEYGTNGGIVRGVDPMGSVVGYECDAAGLPVAVTDPLGGRTAAVRDSFGRVVAVTDAAGATTRFQWTVEGLLALQVDPDGSRTAWSHDAEGNLTGTVDALGAASTVEVGPFGRAKAQTGPDGTRREFVHDTELNVLSVTTGGGVWRYAYDPAGRLVGESDFAGRDLAYRYDPAGRMVARRTGLGEWVGFEYDLAGQLLLRRTPEGDYRYSYDAEGRLIGIAGDDSQVGYTWDPSGRLMAETVDGRTTAFEYDLSGRRVRRITPSGAVSEWSYDAAGLPASLRAGSATLTFGFDVAGREVERLLPGASLSREFDTAGRPAQQLLQSGAGADRRTTLERRWSRRADGVPTEVRDSLRGTRYYETDPVGRVTAVTAQGWRETYAYDEFGNVAAETLQQDREPGVTELPRQTDRTRTRQARRTTYEYDDAGRVVRTVRRTLDGRRLVREFAWNSEDRLIRAVTPDGTTWHYGYDPVGRRTSKARVGGDGTVGERTVFVWEGPMTAEQHTYAPDGSVVVVTWDYDPGSVRPAAQRRRELAVGADPASAEETFHAVVTDLAGTPTELVADDGGIAWYTTTDLWGRAIAVSDGHGVDCPLRFPGQYHDAETGLNYNLHRYYDPESGAYLTPDPLGLEAGPNDHAYVPNPLIDTDPFGLMCNKALLKWAEEANGKAEDYHAITNTKDTDWFFRNGTTAVVKARFPDGNGGWVVKNVVAQSGEAMDLRVVSAAFKNGDIPVPDNVPGLTHAEHNALHFINQAGGVPVAGGSSRNVCKTVCGPFVRATNGLVMGPVRPGFGEKVRTFFWPGSMSPPF